MKKRLFPVILLMLSLMFAGCNRMNNIPDIELVDLPVNQGKANNSNNTNSSNHDIELVDLPVKNKRVECDWTLHVDDTIHTEINGVKIAHTLIIDAVKLGGKDDKGIFEGTVTLSSNADLGALTGVSSEIMSLTGSTGGAGTDSQAKIEVVDYDFNEYRANDLVVPLGEFDGMALGAFNLSGYGFFDVNLSGKGMEGNAEEEYESVVSLPYKMTVQGGQVKIDIPSLKAGKMFRGMITGTPKE